MAKSTEKKKKNPGMKPRSLSDWIKLIKPLARDPHA